MDLYNLRRSSMRMRTDCSLSGFSWPRFATILVSHSASHPFSVSRRPLNATMSCFSNACSSTGISFETAKLTSYMTVSIAPGPPPNCMRCNLASAPRTECAHRTRSRLNVQGARTAYLWSVDPSMRLDCLRRGGPGRWPGGWAHRRRRRCAGRCRSERSSCHVGWLSPIGLLGTVGLASVLELCEGGQPDVGCRGIPSSRPVAGVIMKPCGHDRGELNQLRRPHRLVGHADHELRRGRARHHAASVVLRQRISPSRRP